MMCKKMLALVAPYFGKLPAHFQLWLDSCAANPQVDWLLYTDDRTAWDYPDNVLVTYCTLGDLRERFQGKFDFDIALDHPRKLCDYKPLYGYLFEEELGGYRAWGHCDPTDTIFGDFSKFVTCELIDRYDRLGYLGHLTVYRNTPEVRRRFMASTGIGPTYREVLTSSRVRVFDEPAPGSIDEIWRHNGWTTDVLDDRIADLSAYSYAFDIGSSIAASREGNRSLVFEWCDGRLIGLELAKYVRGVVASREYLYVHFKRRKAMPVDSGLNPSHYIITPRGFEAAPDGIEASQLRFLGRGKTPDPMWLAAKWGAAKTKIRVGILRKRTSGAD